MLVRLQAAYYRIVVASPALINDSIEPPQVRLKKNHRQRLYTRGGLCILLPPPPASLHAGQPTREVTQYRWQPVRIKRSQRVRFQINLTSPVANRTLTLQLVKYSLKSGVAAACEVVPKV